MQTETLVLDIKEAAARLRLSPWTIRRWIQEKKLPVVRLGRRVMVEPKALKQLVAKNREAASV
jgi:excisionase family DNA binding protein